MELIRKSIRFVTSIFLAVCLVVACSPCLLLGPAVQAHAATAHVVGLEIYPYTIDSSGKWLKEIKRTKDSNGQYWVKGGISEKAGQIRMNVEAYWSNGVAYLQSDDNWKDVDLTWKSSDKEVAVVSSNGTVTATGNGSAAITVTDEADNLSAKIGIKVAGQEGAYVTAVYICNEKGRQYEDERITYTSKDKQLKLYVREEFSDGTTASNAPEADDYKPDALTTITWSVSDTDGASINSSTGVFIAKDEALSASGTTSEKVYATATGGGVDSKNGQVKTHVYVNIKGDGSAGEGEDGYASDSLTVHVVYDKYPDYVVKTLTYTLDDLKAIEDVQSTYTFSRSDGEYVTASGEGIYLTTLIEKAGVSTEQVKSFTFTANDGVNPGKMSYDYLFRARYYWPNYEFANNKVGAVNVYPMLAYASDWRDSKDGSTNCDADYKDLPTKTRLRLLFGSATSSDNSTDHSLKYISEMTIRIDGAPPSSNGEDDNGPGSDGSGSGTAAPGSDGSGSDTAASGSENADNGNVGDGSGSETDTSATQGSPTGVPDGTSMTTANGEQGTDIADNTSTSETGTTTAGASEKGSSEVTKASKAKNTARGQNVVAASSNSSDQTQDQSQASSSPSKKWQAYQMINPLDNTNFDIDELDDNVSFVIALVIGAFLLVAAAARARLVFRRQLDG